MLSRRWLTMIGLLGLAALLAGCEPPPLSNNGVVCVFGNIGMGPGEFSYPRAINIDRQGRVYVVDKSARVQRFSSEGKLQAEWNMPDKRAGKPIGVTVADDGRVFIADTHYNRVIVTDENGKELARFGTKGFGDGEFQLPTDVAIDAQGNIYVSEYNGSDRVTKWSSDFKFLKVIAQGEVDGAPISRPSGIDIDAEQTLWVADACNHRVLRFDLEGKFLAAWGELGSDSGHLRYPYDITCTVDGEILVCEFGNHRLQWFSKDGNSRGVWGAPGRRVGELWAPWGAAVGPDERIYVVDSLNARVQVIKL